MKPRSQSALRRELWIVVLLSPVAWTAALGALLPMTDWVCERGSRSGMLIVGGICALLSLAPVPIGWKRLAQHRRAQERRLATERSQFMLELGIGMSAIFALVILLYLVPVFLLRSCPT